MKSKDIKKFGSTLVTGEIYHIFSKSIAGFRIFKRKAEFKRIKEMLQYYVFEKPSIRFSYFLRAPQKEKEKFVEAVSKNNIQNKNIKEKGLFGKEDLKEFGSGQKINSFILPDIFI